jgi:hypothetical protein
VGHEERADDFWGHAIRPQKSDPVPMQFHAAAAHRRFDGYVLK